MNNRRSWKLAALLVLLTWSRWVYSQTQIQVGYAVITADVAGRLPVGTALFSYTNGDGVLVSEAAVGASQPIKSGRTFVNEAETKTGVALANPSAQTANITLILRD